MMRHVMRDYRSYYTVQPLGTKLRNRSHFLSIQTLLWVVLNLVVSHKHEPILWLVLLFYR